jgi:hypothetical protein
MTIGDVYFGQGDNEYVVHRPALENVVTRYRTHQREYEDFTEGHWVGDCVLGKALKDPCTSSILFSKVTPLETSTKIIKSSGASLLSHITTSRRQPPKICTTSKNMDVDYSLSP